MPAFIICHYERGGSQRAATEGRARLSERISELWGGTLQLDGTWIVHAASTSDQIRDELLPFVSEQDALIVIGAGRDAAWAGFEARETDWLVEHIG